jgi:hypothetical protein
MLTKTPGVRPKRAKASSETPKKRLDAWRNAVERSREIPLEQACFAIQLEVREVLLDVLRGRDDRVSTRRKMMADPISELADYIDQKTDVPFEHDPERAAAAESITKAFEYFGLNPDIPAHRGFFLAILADVYLNTPVSGRPRGTAKWTRHRYLRFGAHLHILHFKFPNANLEELAEEIKKVLPIECKHEDSKSFRKRLGTARRLFTRLLEEDGLTAGQWLYVAGYQEDQEARRQASDETGN